jgi:Protein of unknown function (DUF2778)
MAWIYSQSSGQLTRDGEPVACGYSGAGSGRNNPAEQAVTNVGPIPQGRYTIGPEFDAPVQGPCTMRLSPQGHDALGRRGFLIHGDNIAHDASTGCVILPPEIRREIAASPDRDFEVVA